MNAPVDSLQLDESPMSGVQLSVQQNLPEWGWSRGSREVAELRVAASRQQTAEAEAQLRRSVEVLYWKLALTRILHGVTTEHLERTEELMRAVRARYEVGDAAQNSMLRLMVLRDRLKDDLGDYQRGEKEISAGLARTLSRPPETVFVTPTEILAVPVAEGSALWTEKALKARPELLKIQEEIKLERKAAELARIQARPDLSLWMKYRIRDVDTAMDDGTDFVSAGISIPIPWGSRKASLGREAAHRHAERGAKARLDSVIDAIESDLVSMEARWSRAYAKSFAYRNELLPMAQTALETTLSDYAVGQAGFSTLYESEVDLLMLETSYFKASVATYIERAAVRATTGQASLGELQ